MVCILADVNDPFFCLAAEEFLLKNYREDICMLWQSHNTVVIGKHQNAMAEIDYRFTRDNGINIARRISGGGTVFHDEGNVNFTFIRNVSSPQEISFRQFTQPVVDFLSGMGITAETSGRNDLIVKGKKISGNAEHIFKNRVLHHGTLLYSSDLNNLGDSIRVKEGKYKGKAVQSNRSIVANISDYMKTKMPVYEFMQHLMNFLLAWSGTNTRYNLSENEIREIQSLSEEKFQTWEWTYGYSPAYEFSNHVTVKDKILTITAQLVKSRFRELTIEGTFYSKAETGKIREYLTGRPHQYEEIHKAHQMAGISVTEDLIYNWF